jgi:hypothetical protein
VAVELDLPGVEVALAGPVHARHVNRCRKLISPCTPGIGARYPKKETTVAQTKAQRQAAARKAAATRQRKRAARGAKQTKSSATAAVTNVTKAAKAAGKTARDAGKAAANRAESLTRR